MARTFSGVVPPSTLKSVNEQKVGATRFMNFDMKQLQICRSNFRMDGRVSSQLVGSRLECGELALDILEWDSKVERAASAESVKES